MEFATQAGTRRFKERVESKNRVAKGHFRSSNELELTSVGMGTYLGDPDLATDIQVTQAVIESITSGAVNVIDTAINYRSQKAEKSVGKALRELFSDRWLQRDEVFISTKNGYLTPEADIKQDFRTYIIENLVKPGILNPQDICSGSHCMSTSYLKDQLNRSLKNLDLKTIDLMYIHNAAESQLREIGRQEFMNRLRAAFKFYEEQRQEGEIRYYGMATWTCFRAPSRDPEYLNLEDAVQVARDVGGENHGFKYIQLPFNLGMPEALTERHQRINGQNVSILEASSRLGVGVFTSVPLLQGQLLRYQLPEVPGLRTPAQKCIQFVRSTPGVIAPLVGQKRREHVLENLETAQVPPLDIETYNRIFGSA